MSHRLCSHCCSHSQNHLQVRGGDTDRYHHGAEFCILLSVVHQSSWKFCMCLYLGFTALLAEHRPHIVIVHSMRSLMGRTHSPSGLCVCSQMFCEVLVFHHSSPTSSTTEAIFKMHVCIFFICKRVTHFGYDHSGTKPLPH
jgi:hypothetical protein